MYTNSSSERDESWGWTIKVYRKKLGSTHAGSCMFRECRAVIACSGLDVAVETASMTEPHVKGEFVGKKSTYEQQDDSNLRIWMESNPLQHIVEVRPTKEF